MLDKITYIFPRYYHGKIPMTLLVIYSLTMTVILGIFMHSTLSRINIDSHMIMSFRLWWMRFAIDSWNAG